MLNFAEQTGSGAVTVLWSILTVELLTIDGNVNTNARNIDLIAEGEVIQTIT